MNDKAFVDTNILVYTVDSRFPQKQEQAKQLLQTLQQNHQMVISTQVLQEFYAVTTKKLKLDLADMQKLVHEFAKLPVVLTDIKLIENAIAVSIHHHLSLWDSLMLVGAVRANCQIMYSEDLTHGQIIQGVKILNPFIENKENQ